MTGPNTFLVTSKVVFLDQDSNQNPNSRHSRKIQISLEITIRSVGLSGGKWVFVRLRENVNK